MPSLWTRQLTFLRRRWWNHHPLTPVERVFSFLRGVILIGIAVFGVVVVSTNTLGLSGRGMDAVSKLLAEFLLIPVGILAFIMAAYGLSQIARSLIPNATVARQALSHAEWEEEQSEEFQLRDEDQP